MGNFRFYRAVVGSLVVHLSLFALVLLLPAGEAGTAVTIYKVRVVEAPPKPKVRELTLSTAAVSELKLEAPSLTLRPEPEPEEPRTRPEAPEALPLPEADLPATLPADQSPPPGKLALPAAPADAARLPRLPTAPKPEPPGQTPPARAGKPAGLLEKLLAVKPPEAPPQRETPLQKLKAKVRNLNLNFEEAPASGTAGSRASVLPEIFKNLIRERIKKNYTFPGGFHECRPVRIRVTIEKNGALTQMEILGTSGNQQCDLAARLAVRSTRFPPLPESLAEDRLIQVFRFSP